MEQRPVEIFFTRDWHHRTWRTWLAFLGCAGIGGVAFFILVGLLLKGNPTREPLWKVVAGCAMLFTVGSVMTLVAATAALRLIRNPTETSTIDTAGISVGKHRWRWDEMRFIQPELDGFKGVVIKIALKGKLDQMFWIGRSLTQAEFKELSGKLLPFLESNHPDLMG